MASASASIHSIQDSDDTLVRFMCAKAIMVSLAAANRQSYRHPLVVVVWIGLSSILVEYMHWYPKPQHGFIGYLTPTKMRPPTILASPASGFWMVDYGERFVGLIAIDASEETATIRHFYVQEPYPATGIQDDLLSHAVNHCFNAHSGTVQHIRATDSSLVPYVGKALQNAGFVLDEHTETVGVLRWKLRTRLLRRDIWEKKRA
ncbi:hypothetical protein C8R46DRAFT_1090588 [Mycena filopes]|nr:hypothetical protein C8R46DRAFT_1090588 [Mycena filopes]